MMPPTEPSLAADRASAGPSEVMDAPPVAREVGFLSLLLGRIFRGIRGMVPLVFAMSCQSADPPVAAPSSRSEVPAEPAPAVRVVEEPAPPAETGPRELGKFNITFYYVVGEEEVVARANRKPVPANDNATAAAPGTPDAEGGDKELAAVAPPPEKLILYGPGKGCDPIAETTREFLSELRMQGSGKLLDGRVVSMWGPCKCPNSPCFHVVEQQWGMGGAGRALQPFRSVAVDPKLIKLGSLLYVPLLEGRTMPGRPPWGGFVHDGCVIADDTGGAVRNYQLDLFVGRRGWFLGMSGHPGPHSWARQIPVFDGTKLCERKGRKVARKSGSI